MESSLQKATVTGPYHYEHDIHPSFNVSTHDRIVASVYAVDGDEDRAEREALLFAGVLSADHSDLASKIAADAYRMMPLFNLSEEVQEQIHAAIQLAAEPVIARLVSGGA